MKPRIHGSAIIGILLCGMAALGFSVRQRPAQLSTFEGQIIDALTQRPVAGAAVRLQAASTNSSSVSDRNGRFVFANVSEGEHRVLAYKQGYLDGLPVRVVVGAELQDFVYRLAPAGVIAGRVVDDHGRPIRGAAVQALAYGYQNGKRQLLPRGNRAVSDDRGEFRLFWLEPREHYIVINPPQPAPPRLGYLPSDHESRFVRTYFPGTADVDQAEAVKVGYGELDVRAIHLAARPVRLLRARVLNGNLKQHVLPATLSIRPLADLPFSWSDNYNVLLSNEEFEVRSGFAPGTYRVRIVVGSPDGTFAGGATMTVDRADPEVVEIPLSRPMTVSGRVNIDGDGALDLRPLSLSMTSTAGVVPSQPFSRVRPDGSFKFEDVVAETYAVRVDGLADDAYLAGVQLDDQEVPPARVDFRQGAESAAMTLSIRTDGGRVTGVVTDLSGKNRADATVVLIPNEQLRERLELFKSAKTDDKGQFEIRAVAPGAYTILAFERMDPGAHQDPSFSRDFESTGITLRVPSGGRLAIPLISIPQ